MHILIADDVAIVRRSVRGLLAEAFPHARFAEAGNGDEVMNWLAKSEFCILMLDLRMPGRGGMDVLRDVKRSYPNLPVIIVSGQPKEQYAAPCLKAGAAAYISKDSACEELAIATRKVLDVC